MVACGSRLTLDACGEQPDLKKKGQREMNGDSRESFRLQSFSSCLSWCPPVCIYPSCCKADLPGQAHLQQPIVQHIPGYTGCYTSCGCIFCKLIFPLKSSKK
jgi:hypothetical protein